MAKQKFTNSAISHLVGALTNVATSMSVTGGEGALFPSLAAGEWFMATLVKTSGVTQVKEIVKVTARATDTMTIVRGQEGTTATTFAIGDLVDLRITAGTMDNVAQLVADNAFTGANSFTGGSITVPTQAAGNSSTNAASTAYVRGEYAAPPALGSTTPAAVTATTLRANSHAKVIADAPTAQSLVNNTDTTITNWTEALDTGSNFNNSTGVFTAPRTGHYLVTAQISFASASWSAANGEATVILRRNGVNIRAARSVNSAATTLTMSSPTLAVTVSLTAGDTLEIRGYQLSGGAINTVASSNTFVTITELP